jgi:uncharacterized membrane protein
LNRVWDGIQYRRSCYNDVIPLYGGRGLDHKRFPYIHSTERSRTAGQDLEYPVGTGLYVGTVAKTVDTPTGFFNADAVGLALMGIGAALALAAMALEPRRVLLYAIGPAMILYAFHNWDLLAVGMATLAMYAYWRGADAWAGLLLGLGAATKLYPAFLLPAFALSSWRRDNRPPWRMVATFLLGAAALNLPVMLANFQGWKYPWDFQSARTANFETSWYMVARHLGPEHAGWFTDSSFVNTFSGGLFVAISAVLIAVEARRERVRPFALGFGILIAFLLTAKVFSPQYALWLLPFFAVLRLPWWSYAAFALTDAAVWFGVSAFFLAYQVGAGDPGPRLTLLEIAVWARYGALLILLILSRDADELVLTREPENAPVALSA